jgi:4-aminobutyrate aminotransferase
VRDRETKERAADWRDQVIQNAFQKGLLLLGCGENTIRICPALTVNSEEVEVFLTIFEESLKALFD